MKIDLISIFPEYFAPLKLSLIGKAEEEGLLNIEVHDLRDFTSDIHRTVDDTPYGGGAGMVMKAQPWGDATDVIIENDPQVIVIVPTPSGQVLTQEIAEQLSTADHLLFLCGRYEGIDARVMTDLSARVDLREISIGDYVLAGGEVAALVMIEAITRLIPGVLGNAASLIEESHSLMQDGQALVEYPNFTKPPVWRGLQVPDVLTSGNHAEIAKWRAAQAVARTEKIKRIKPPEGDR
ncbi:MAG: tRNA (guanosine(37)-N1)-methyltransferase TrmD [Candidatus Nanopelagicaceae bacterium]|nr:tRNA (guanosine(37)-N1)-methyltransferase TrmD [Candidatus Nanopelagicaceae bacterium]